MMLSHCRDVAASLLLVKIPERLEHVDQRSQCTSQWHV